MTVGFQRIKAIEIADMACGQAEVTRGDQVSNEVALTYVNQGLAELHDLLVATFQDFFIADHSFVAGASEQVLPDDFLRAIRLFDDSTGLPIKRVTLDKLVSAATYPATWGELTYRILGNWIRFTRAPGSSVTMYYVPQFRRLSDLNDEVAYSVPVSWAEFVIADFTSRVLAEEESSFIFYEGRKEQIRKRFAEQASIRDMESEPIRDTEPMDFLEG